MVKISPSIVMVEDISSSLSRTTFSEADLEKAAQLILKMEGIITPIVLQKVGIDSYTVIEGDFEYYAALRAEEIDPMKGETINAYVIKSKKELPFYQQQIEVFRKQSVSTNNSYTSNNIEILNAIRDISIQLSEIDSKQVKQNGEIKAQLKAFSIPKDSTPVSMQSCTKKQLQNKLKEIFSRTKGLGDKTLQKILDNWS